MISNNYSQDDLDKLFHHQNNNNQKAILSIAAIEDNLVSTISSHNTAEIDKEGIHIKWRYQDQAKTLIYRINVYDPLPEFVIFTEDIPEGLSQQLNDLDIALRKKVITNAVRRIYESVDPEYFHKNSISGKVKWRMAATK
jgi:hypothetical protein